MKIYIKQIYFTAFAILFSLSGFSQRHQSIEIKQLAYRKLPNGQKPLGLDLDKYIKSYITTDTSIHLGGGSDIVNVAFIEEILYDALVDKIDDDENENYGNQIGNDFKNNTTLGSAFGNTIGNNCDGDVWGDGFFNNHLGNNFKSNTCGTNFQHNILPFDFYSNTCNDDFQNWNGQCRLNGVNFNAVTTTPQDSKFIIRDNGLGDIRVGYWVNGVMTYQSF